MPITQERFLIVLRGAKAILDKQRSLQQVTEDAEQIISEAHAALDRINEPNIKHALLPMPGMVNTMVTIVRSMDLVYLDLLATVLAELKHFDKVKVSNARAAKLQRNERERKGIKPRLDFMRGEQLAPSMTPTLQPLFLDGMPSAKPPTVPLEETQGFKNFEQRMIKLREKLNNEEKVNG